MMFAGLEFTVSQQTEARVLLSYFPSLGSEQVRLSPTARRTRACRRVLTSTAHPS
jgi:hypothetical protein